MQQTGHQRRPSSWHTSGEGFEHGVLQLKGPEERGLKYYGRGRSNHDVGAASTDQPVPSNVNQYYFKVCIVDCGQSGAIGIGFCAPGSRMDRMPGWDQHSYGYHGDDGKAFADTPMGCVYGPTFTTGDVIGALLNRKAQTVSFFKNDENLGVAFINVNEHCLYPTVGLHTPGAQVVAHFGDTCQGCRTPNTVASCDLEYSRRGPDSRELSASASSSNEDQDLDKNLLTWIASGLPVSAATEPANSPEREDRLEALRYLEIMGLIENLDDPVLTLSPLGELVEALPVSVEFGVSIAAAEDADCSREVAVIACVYTVSEGRDNLFEPHSTSRRSSFLRNSSGDPETYLKVYEAWLASGQDEFWCARAGVSPQTLEAAHCMLTEINDIMPSTNRSYGADWDHIMASLCMGFVMQSADAVDCHDASQGFILSEDRHLAFAAPDSVFSSPHNQRVSHVIYFGAFLGSDDCQILQGVGSVRYEWLMTANRRCMDGWSDSDTSSDEEFARDTAFVEVPDPMYFVDQAVSHIMGGVLHNIYAQYGRGVAGSLMAIASRLLLRSANQGLGLWLYGGFVRDMIVRNDPPKGMDLDIGLPVHWRGPDAAASMEIVIEVAEQLEMRVKRKMNADRRVCIAFFTTVDQSSEVEVQVVDTAAFAERDPRIDFDVNNLRLDSSGTLSLKRHEDECCNCQLYEVVENIRAKRLLVLKPPNEVTARIIKMRQRGWRIVVSQP